MQKIILLCGAAMILAACNTTPTKQARAPVPAEIQVEEAIGFTIVESARIDGDVRVDYDRAQDLLEQGRLNDAVKLLEAVVEQAPELSVPRIDLAIAYHRMDDVEAAEEHLLKVLEINPQHPIALNEIGIIYRKTARFAEARRSYEAALAVYPGYHYARRNLAVLCDLYPGYHYARRNLAVLCDLYLADLQCAADNYEAYMATVHSDDEAAMWLKDVQFRLGRTE